MRRTILLPALAGLRGVIPGRGALRAQAPARPDIQVAHPQVPVSATVYVTWELLPKR